MTDLFLCVDPGASQTKIVYQLDGDNSPQYLLMSPDVEMIEQSTLDFYFASKGWVGCPAPIQEAWLQIKNEIFIVGDFAESFDPEDRINELKYENALYKVLAAIGIIQQRYDLNPRKKISIQLAILLPANEYNDRHRFHEKLASMIGNFSFRGIQIKGKLKRLLCRPEGGGLATIAISHNGLSWFQERRLGVLMLGHRNVSGLYFERGNIKIYESPLIGFSQFLDSIVLMTSGLNRHKLADAIFQSLTVAGSTIYKNSPNSNESHSCTEHPNWKKYQPIQELATAKDSGLRQLEIEAIVSSIETATFQYWKKVSKWMDKIFNNNLDAIVVSGGAARYLEPELENYFNCEPIHGYDSSLGKYERDCYFRSGEYKIRDERYPFTPIIWGAGSQEQLETALALTDKQQSLSYRLVDAFGLFEQLTGRNSLTSSSDLSKEVNKVG